ncbi:MAG: class I SAM-dependent methyltransferase [archaeon]|nr:class I SAM-dependent methyltransferase [archaeon]
MSIGNPSSSMDIDMPAFPQNNNVNEKYSAQRYWETRYMEYSNTFEWLESYDTLSPYLTKLFSDIASQIQLDVSSLNVMNIGCGTSELPEKLYTDLGIRNILNIDFSQTVINAMQRKYLSCPEILWECANAFDENYFSDPNKKDLFDVIIDKFTGDTFSLMEESEPKILSYYSNVYSCLKNGGVFLMITNDNEKGNMLMKSKFGMNFKIEEIKQEYQSDNDLIMEPFQSENYLVYALKVRQQGSQGVSDITN